MGKVVIIATLDTKGHQVAYLRNRLQSLGVATLVVDAGVLGEPVGITPDVSHEQLAHRRNTTIEAIRDSSSRGEAVATMRELVVDLVAERHAAGELIGGISIGGVGAVIGAAAIQQLPVGMPKIVLAPTASGHHEFGPYVGRKDVHVVHSVVDLLGLNPVLTTVLDNVAASMKGMLDHGRILRGVSTGSTDVAVTMLGNTTTAVEALAARLALAHYEAVVFHSNGVGGPAMEELAHTGQFVGVIDYTTNEIYDPLVGGIHDGGPKRLSVAGKLGLPQVLLPGCIDFSVWTPATIPPHMRSRPSYEHNPEYTLVRATHDEKVQLGEIFAARVNGSTGPVRILLPTQGLSIPAVPGGEFWDPTGDEKFFRSLERHIRPDITLEYVDLHINDPALGRIAAERFIDLREQSAAAVNVN